MALIEVAVLVNMNILEGSLVALALGWERFKVSNAPSFNNLRGG